MADTTDLRYKQQRKSYLQRVANLQDKFPNIPREVIEDSIASGKNPSQHFKNLKSSITKKNIARGVGKGATKVAGKSILPISILQFLKGKPAGANSDIVPDDPFKRGGKVKKKKKKKKSKSKTKKIMYGYKAGGKV